MRPVNATCDAGTDFVPTLPRPLNIMAQHSFDIHHREMTIRGTCYLPDVARRVPTVLLLHSFTGNRIESGFMFVQIARALCQEGIAAVTFDFRHSGESDGTFEDMLVSGQIEDALRMTEWLGGRPFADRSRLGLLGFSLGGLVAACLSARTTIYRALMLVAPTTVDNLCRVAGEAKPDRPARAGPHHLHPRLFEDLRQLDPIGDCTRNPRPTLVVHGSEDTAVPPDVCGEFIIAMQTAGIDLVANHIPDADHTFSRKGHRTALIDAVTTWSRNVMLQP